MTPDDHGIQILGASNYAWLKEYMAPIRERVERERALADARAEILEMESENRDLKQMVTDLSRNHRPATGFFKQYLPQLFHISLK